MATISKYHIPSVGLFLLGIVSIALAIQTFPHPFQQEYYHDVTEISESEISESTDVRTYSELSSSGQDAFESALKMDSTMTIYGEANRPQDFEYGDIIDHTYIKYEGNYYDFVTYSGGIVFIKSLIYIILIASGIGLIGLAVASLKYSKPQFPIIILTGVLTMLLVGISDDYFTYKQSAIYLWSIPISGVMSGGAVWWLLNHYFE